MKACLAVDLVEQTQADEIYDRLGDGTEPTGNVNLWEKKKKEKRLVGYPMECDMIDGERGGE